VAHLGQRLILATKGNGQAMRVADL